MGTKMTWEIGKVLQKKILSTLKSVTRGQQKQPFAAAFLSGDAALSQSHTHTHTRGKSADRQEPCNRKGQKGKEGPSWL